MDLQICPNCESKMVVDVEIQWWLVNDDYFKGKEGEDRHGLIVCEKGDKVQCCDCSWEGTKYDLTKVIDPEEEKKRQAKKRRDEAKKIFGRIEKLLDKPVSEKELKENFDEFKEYFNTKEKKK